MATESHSAAVPQTPDVTISVVDDRRAVLGFSGELNAHMVLELEELLMDQRLRDAQEWVLEMEDLKSIDLACAYALLRAQTRLPATATVHIRGARRDVQRTLRHTGVDAKATIEE
ncbi:STAS domain-containing protein [Streptomyces sp. NPDC018833]|uniref:STAS domain-containing protein n=1 Tax=Streptomyces sp. NPDC018833 TaxID=3365053 RepID=UPI0037B364D6